MALFTLKYPEVAALRITDISPSFSGHDITLEGGSTHYAHSVPDNIGPGDYLIFMNDVVYNDYSSDFILMEQSQFESMFVKKQTQIICRRCGLDISPASNIEATCQCHPSKVEMVTITK